jgi:hypothetical protein
MQLFAFLMRLRVFKEDGRCWNERVGWEFGFVVVVVITPLLINNLIVCSDVN